MIKTTPLQDRIDPNTGRPKALQHNKNDAANEQRVADVLYETQGIVLHPYATYSPIDYWMEKDNSVIGFAELKTSFLDKESPMFGNSTNTISPNSLCAKSVIPTIPVDPSKSIHSWSFVYLNFSIIESL